MWLQLPSADGCDLDQRDLLPRAFDAFADDDQRLDYARFVEMVRIAPTSYLPTFLPSYLPTLDYARFVEMVHT